MHAGCVSEGRTGLRPPTLDIGLGIGVGVGVGTGLSFRPAVAITLGLGSETTPIFACAAADTARMGHIVRDIASRPRVNLSESVDVSGDGVLTVHAVKKKNRVEPQPPNADLCPAFLVGAPCVRGIDTQQINKGLFDYM